MHTLKPTHHFLNSDPQRFKLGGTKERKLILRLVLYRKLDFYAVYMTREYRLITGGYSNTISTLSFNPTDRSLLKINQTTTQLKLAAPTWLVLQGDILYALQEWGANQYGEGIISAFKINRLNSHNLEFINSVGSFSLPYG